MGLGQGLGPIGVHPARLRRGADSSLRGGAEGSAPELPRRRWRVENQRWRLGAAAYLSRGRGGRPGGRARSGRGLDGSWGRVFRRSPHLEERCAGPGAGGAGPGSGLFSEPTVCLVCAFLSLFLSPRLGFAHSTATRTVRSTATSPWSARRRNVPHGLRTGTWSWLPCAPAALRAVVSLCGSAVTLQRTAEH